MTRYNKSAVMKAAHARFKADREHFPDAPLKFSDYLEMAWFDEKIDYYYENVYCVEPDGWACYDFN